MRWGSWKRTETGSPGMWSACCVPLRMRSFGHCSVPPSQRQVNHCSVPSSQRQVIRLYNEGEVRELKDRKGDTLS